MRLTFFLTEHVSCERNFNQDALEFYMRSADICKTTKVRDLEIVLIEGTLMTYHKLIK